jgi:hypothetical protein
VVAATNADLVAASGRKEGVRKVSLISFSAFPIAFVGRIENAIEDGHNDGQDDERTKIEPDAH